jgi:DNA-binding NarL/FixJ family response regulator
MNSPLRVALMEDHAIVRAGIAALLERIEGVTVVADVSHAAALMQALADVPVDVVLCDLNVPGMDGIACIEHLHRHHPHVKCIVLSMEDSATAARLACSRGAVGYVVKHAAATELGSALQGVREGRPYFSPRIARMLLEQPSDAPDEALTARQVQIVRHVAEGLSSREIGVQLGLSARTVEMHRARIMERLELRDVAALTRYAIRYRLVGDAPPAVDLSGALRPCPTLAQDVNLAP